MSKNDYVFTAPSFYVNKNIAILILLESVACSPSTGLCCAICAGGSMPLKQISNEPHFFEKILNAILSMSERSKNFVMCKNAGNSLTTLAEELYCCSTTP